MKGAIAVLMLLFGSWTAQAQNMRAACDQTRRQVQSGQVTCDQIRQNQRAVDDVARRNEQNARETRGAQSFSRLHSAAASAARAGSQCYTAILSSQCGGPGGGSPAQERAAIRRMEQEQAQLEAQLAVIQEHVQAEMAAAQALAEYVEANMPWILSDEERERLRSAGAHVQRVDTTLDVQSGETSRHIEELQRQLGLSLPPGTHLDQVGSGYVLRDGEGRVRYRLERLADGSYDMVPTPGALRD
ncbi:MAG: hypothetical protein K8H88_30345, partial [Sandaracinaceae bacterium]|nr:hypothetical protein [Sandaracinaceae bacterium]